MTLALAYYLTSYYLSPRHYLLLLLRLQIDLFIGSF